MLNRIIIKNFFSFHDENTIILHKGVNLLLGINGSGKTSFINALRLLFEGISENSKLEDLIQAQWGGFDQIVNCTGKEMKEAIQITYVFNGEIISKYNPASNFHSDVYYQITIHPLGNTDYYLDEKIFTKRADDSDSPFIFLDFHNGKGKLSTRTEDEGIQLLEYDNDDFGGGHELVLKRITDPIHYLPLHTLHRGIEAMSVYNSFDTGESSSLRKLSPYSTGTKLWKNGENLTQILNYLCNNHSLDFDRIEENLHKVNPTYKSIHIDNMSGQAYLTLREKNLNKAVGALHLSDGTLRFLLLESIFLNPNRGKLVAIDEPERGLHPDMIKAVSDMIKVAAKESKLIIATHSPQLLNQFTLDDILVFEKDDGNSTVVKSISEDDFPEDKDCSLPGLLWLNGEIGGKRW